MGERAFGNVKRIADSNKDSDCDGKEICYMFYLENGFIWQRNMSHQNERRKLPRELSLIHIYHYG